MKLTSRLITPCLSLVNPIMSDHTWNTSDTEAVEHLREIDLEQIETDIDCDPTDTQYEEMSADDTPKTEDVTSDYRVDVED